MHKYMYTYVTVHYKIHLQLYFTQGSLVSEVAVEYTLYTCTVHAHAPVTAKHLNNSLWFLIDVELVMSTGTHA